MRLCSFELAGRPSWGLRTADGLLDGGAASGMQFGHLRALLESGTWHAAAAKLAATARPVDEDRVTYLPVIPNPRKIVCVGVNYDEHRQETGRSPSSHPTLFTRFADTQVGHGQPLLCPRESAEFDYEGELAVIIGRGGRYIRKDRALAHVAGYSCYNDGSVRDYQRHSMQFTPGKNFPGTGGLGPDLVTSDEIGDPGNLRLRTRLNGAVMQDAMTSLMIFDIPALLEYISTFTPLYPGDVIATGTPGGVGCKREPPVYLQPGDVVEVEIDKVGVLSNPVREAPPPD